MRVLLVSANYRPSVGGIERFVEVLAQGLAWRGHHVTVVACLTRGAPADERDQGVRILRIPSSDLLHERLNVPYPLPAPIACVRTLRALIADVDVVHVQDALYLTSVTALLLARRHRKASILTQHVAFVPQHRTLLDLAQGAAIATLGRCARLATRVATYNPQVAKWAARTWGLDDVQVLSVGVPPVQLTDAERAEVRRELGLAEHVFVALFSGRDVPKKRLDVFLAARDPAYELVAVTDRRAGAAPGARLIPFTSPERFGRLLAAADAFVLPSEGEGFPLALQEALVCGVACVVTPGPGYERYLRDGEALLVPPEPGAIRASLRRLAADPILRQALAIRARRAGAREFGLEPFVRAYEGLYCDAREAVVRRGGR